MPIRMKILIIDPIFPSSSSSITKLPYDQLKIIEIIRKPNICSKIVDFPITSWNNICQQNIVQKIKMNIVKELIIKVKRVTSYFLEIDFYQPFNNECFNNSQKWSFGNFNCITFRFTQLIVFCIICFRLFVHKYITQFVYKVSFLRNLYYLWMSHVVVFSETIFRPNSGVQSKCVF